MFLKKMILAAAATLVLVVPSVAQESTDAPGVPRREHRAIWMTPFLSNNWPGSALTESNTASQKRILTNRLDKFKEQNINVIYYHARATCDATYKSSYEPWSSTVAPSRGAEPAFDPFEFIIEECHKRGIELYAWVNPYRYNTKPGKTPYGAGDRNYENTHPEWLISSELNCVLNPALEDVKVRVLDVIGEIVTNYDVDGVVFDDYFYGQGGTAMSVDAEQYKAYTASGGKMSQADWRRWHVNDMVHRVNERIKSIKPYVVFGIGPAGVSSPTNIETEYGLPPISGDWQYNQIYSDPLAWLKGGDIDFISPQIYWPSRYTELCQWWSNAAVKFNRHFYSSIDISDLSTSGTFNTAEVFREIESARSIQPADCSGMVYFHYGPYINFYERVYGKNLSLGENLAVGEYPTKALTPLRPWNNVKTPAMTADVRISDGVLTWKEVPGMRYTVYAHPKAENTPFCMSQNDLHSIVYTNELTLPSDADQYDWYVAVYDRYGNEYTPLGIGATPTAATPSVPVYPIKGETAVDLFEFKWTNAMPGLSIVEVADDPEFAHLIGTISTTGQTALSTQLPTLESGKKYYWRVSFTGVNAQGEVMSPVNEFSVSRIAISAPVANAADVSLNPVVEWTKASDGAKYTLEISSANTFSKPEYTVTTTETSTTIPARTLMTGRKYYARLTATLGSGSSVSDVVPFQVVNRTDYTTPAFVAPITDGATLHSNECIAVEPWEGMCNVVINISASATSFSARSMYTSTLSNFETQDKALSNVKISSKALVDGTTYYVRTRGSYYDNGTLKYTDYSPVVSFKYDIEAGVDDVVVDGEDAVYVDTEGILHADGAVDIYTFDGRHIGHYNVAGTLSLDFLVRGAYIIRAADATLKYIK